MDANNVQQRMQEIQSNESFSGLFGKLISGREGYKPVIEKKQIVVRCTNCGMIQDDNSKFCPECGTKVERPAKN